MFSQILSKISIVLLLLLIGGLARQRALLTEEVSKGLSRLVIVVTLPFLYFYTLATQCSRELLFGLWMLPVSAVCLVLVSYLFGRVVSFFLHLEPASRNTFTYLTAFTNCGFLAIPIAFALFNQKGVLMVVMFNVGYSILLWTLGVWTLSRTTKTGAHPLRHLLNTGTIGLVLGLLIGVFSLKLPAFFLEASHILGQATIPLALLVIGAILAGGRLRKKVSYRTISFLVICRLVVMPALALVVTALFTNLPYLIRAIIVLQAAMPSASTTPLFTQRFGGDHNLAASGVFFTTLLSIVTVPFFLSLV